MPKHPLVGKKAPSFSLPNFDGETFTFNPGETGRPVALFFYPQSGTYGCTKEACAFRDALSEEEVFKSTQVEVIGVSPDPVEKQKRFVEKQGLQYPILSDEKGEARKAYHVSRGLLGLTSSSRVTFVIDSEGTVQDVLDSTLNFAAHSKFVHNWLKTQAKKITAEKTEEAVQEDIAATAAEPPAPVSTTPAAAASATPAEETAPATEAQITTTEPEHTSATAAAAPTATETEAPAPVAETTETAPATSSESDAPIPPTAPEETVTPPATDTAKEGIAEPTRTEPVDTLETTTPAITGLDPAAAAPAAIPAQTVV